MTSIPRTGTAELITNRSVTELLDDLASAEPAPGGGSGSALTGAMAAALVAMVCRLTLGRASFAAVASRMRQTLSEAETLRGRLTAAVDDDAGAYRSVMSAYRSPRGTAAEREARAGAIQAALKEATLVPLQAAGDCVRLLDLARFVSLHGNPNAASDADVARLLAEAGARGAIRNVKINLPGIIDSEFVEKSKARLELLMAALDQEVEGS